MLCPVCNGLEPLNPICPGCGQIMEDAGRISDMFGPYAPYRPLDESKMTNGKLDLLLNLCFHRLECANCGFQDQRSVQETPHPD